MLTICNASYMSSMSKDRNLVPPRTRPTPWPPIYKTVMCKKTDAWRNIQKEYEIIPGFMCIIRIMKLKPVGTGQEKKKLSGIKRTIRKKLCKTNVAIICS